MRSENQGMGHLEHPGEIMLEGTLQETTCRTKSQRATGLALVLVVRPITEEGHKAFPSLCLQLESGMARRFALANGTINKTGAAT